MGFYCCGSARCPLGQRTCRTNHSLMKTLDIYFNVNILLMDQNKMFNIDGTATISMSRINVFSAVSPISNAVQRHPSVSSGTEPPLYRFLDITRLQPRGQGSIYGCVLHTELCVSLRRYFRGKYKCSSVVNCVLNEVFPSSATTLCFKLSARSQ